MLSRNSVCVFDGNIDKALHPRLLRHVHVCVWLRIVNWARLRAWPMTQNFTREAWSEYERSVSMRLGQKLRPNKVCKFIANQWSINVERGRRYNTGQIPPSCTGPLESPAGFAKENVFSQQIQTLPLWWLVQLKTTEKHHDLTTAGRKNAWTFGQEETLRFHLTLAV